MEQALAAVLSASVWVFASMLAAALLLAIAARLCSCIPAAGMWRIRRTTLAALAVLAVFATIEAQKRTGGEGTQQGEPEGGGAAIPSEGSDMTNTLHFADISVGTNDVVLTLAWPTNFFEDGTMLDLFAATSLVGSAWIWQSAHEVDEGETNWMVSVARESDLRFFCASARADPGDMRDTDGDGIPDVYELHNGTNPYVPDYAAAPKLTVGPSGAFGTIEAAVEASAAYSIVELDPSVSHEIGGQSLGCRIPLHPIMVTAPRPYAVVRSAELSAFMLATNTTSQTLFRNLYLLLDAKDSFQTGFWCGGNLPWSSVPASATFQNIYVRMPNPGVQYRGWLFYAKCAERVSILGCALNAAGATWVTGIDAYDPPPLTIEGCSFVNFPSDSTGGNSCGILLRTSSLDGGTDVALSRTLFDESFVDAWPLARFDSASPCSVTASGCILPCQFPMEYPPDVITNITVTNAALAWVGVPQPDSPSVALGIGSLAPIDNDPSVDTDGDGLADYDEAYNRGTDPYLADSDNDGETDWSEIQNGTDPTDPHSFTQALTVIVTNTVSLAHPLYVAWGNSGTGWETNGLAYFSGGYGTTNYTNASSHGAEFVKAYCDLNGNGEYDDEHDILLVREIPYGSTAQVGFVFGDVDGDGVSDEQERSDATDPYDAGNFRFSVTVKVTNDDNVPTVTNYLAYGFALTGWETNGVVTFAKLNVQPRSMFISDVVTNGNIYVKCYRDLNRNGVYDPGEDALYVEQIGKGYNGGMYAFAIGDCDGDRIPDSIELDEGTNPLDSSSCCFSMAAEIAGIFHTTNQLTLAATFGTNVIYGPIVMATNTWSHDFGHLTANNGERVNLTFWDDANSNGVREAEETSVNITLSLTNHVNVWSGRLSYGAFDADHNDLPDWWEVATGLNAEGVANRLYDDPDGDGLINLHEYWAGCDPLVPDGSNTLLSVAARSIDDRIRNVDPAASVARFNDYFANGSNGVFQANTNFWARDLALSCVNVWQDNGDEPGSMAATLITQRHVVMANHWYNDKQGGLYTFCDTNGCVCRKSLLQSVRISDDLQLGRLSEPLPESFKPAKVLPSDFDRYLSSGKYLPTICLNHKKESSVTELTYLDSNTLGSSSHYGMTSQTNFVSVQRCNIRGATWDGNSGCPVFLVVGDELMLLFSKHRGTRGNVTWASFSGPEVSFRLEAIQNKINEWEGADAGAYQVETLDLSGYNELINKE